jgi:hypothetical protein
MKNKNLETEEVTGERKTKEVSVREVTGTWKTRTLWEMKWRENEKQKRRLLQKWRENKKQKLCERRSDGRTKNKICVCKRLTAEWETETKTMSKNRRKNQGRKGSQSHYENVAATVPVSRLQTFPSPADFADNACCRIQRLQLRLHFRTFFTTSQVWQTCHWN